jgi:hypothetical protein
MGMTNQGIDTFTPNDDFQIIFAFNPLYAELSCAMTNRGVEIAFLPDPQFSGFSLPMPLCKGMSFNATFTQNTMFVARLLVIFEEAASR